MTITRPRRIREKLAMGARAYGITVQLPCPDIVEMAGHVGYDYAWIDAEHGALGLPEIRELIRAADAVGVDSVVRVPDHSPSFIQRVLDLGATGIMAPHVRTVDQARRLSSAVRYAPAGARGACPSVRAVGHLSSDWPSDHRRADSEVLIIGLIEDVDGVENVEAIAGEGGLDALMFGPFDLGMAMGLDGDVSHPELRRMHDRVVSACRASGIEYVTAALAWEFDSLESSGSRIVSVLADRVLINEGLKAPLNALTGNEIAEARR